MSSKNFYNNTGLALRGLDILGAAKTGSGKTLAFLIPILERLFCQRWTRQVKMKIKKKYFKKWLIIFVWLTAGWCGGARDHPHPGAGLPDIRDPEEGGRRARLLGRAGDRRKGPQVRDEPPARLQHCHLHPGPPSAGDDYINDDSDDIDYDGDDEQHLDENPAFSLDNLQMVVLDEADRCLDLGFKVHL